MPFLGNIFSFKKIIPFKNREAYDLIAYLPHENWADPEIVTSFPEYGVRYFICNSNLDPVKFIDGFMDGLIDEDEALDMFDLIIYDQCSLGQMGLYTKKITVDEISKLVLVPGRVLTDAGESKIKIKKGLINE